MNTEYATLWSVPHLDGLQLLRANFITYAFKRHVHDYFVIGMVEQGVQTFAMQRETYITPPTGLIVINPGDAHTGQAATDAGFRYRALYPEADVMQRIASEMKDRPHALPTFSQPVIDDPALFQSFRRLHRALENADSLLAHESRYLWTLAQLIARHADPPPQSRTIKRERQAIRRIRRYIEDHYADNIRLDDLATLVHWSPYYLLRAFKKAVGLPPHAYLESVRIQQAQHYLKANMPLAQVAYQTGFSSQSHLTTTFKRIIGVTPGQYVKEVNILKDGDSHPE